MSFANIRRIPVIKSGAVKKTGEPLESAIKKAILLYLKLIGINAWPVELSGNSYTINGRTFQKRNIMAGFPDILGIISPEGTMLNIEVKRPKKHPTDRQILWLGTLQNAGAECFIAHSVEDVKKWWIKYKNRSRSQIVS